MVQLNVYRTYPIRKIIGRKTRKLDTIDSIECLWYNGFYRREFF